MRTVTCAECGKVFETEHPNKRFCTYECTIRWHSRNTNQARKDAKNLEAVCPVCGVSYVQVRTSQKFCSSKCKERARVSRKSPSKIYTKTCKRCSEDFETGLKRQVLCPECSAKRSHGAKRIHPSLRKEIWLDQRGLCWLCGKKVSFLGSVTHHLDGRGHVNEPDNSKGNLVVLHPECHTMFHRPHLVRRNGEWGIDGKIFGYLKVKNLKVFYEERR